ncbi:MAG: hypothetical protein ACI8XZ_002415 [Gammaproteobacteria bacterium]|jgi:hypothetical protein
MNWDAIGAIGETVGATAIIVSLIYVALQIRHHTSESKTLRTQNLVSVNSEMTAHVANNSDLSRVIRIGMFDYDALDVDQQFQFSLIFYSIYNQYDFAYHQYLNGLLDDTFFKKMDDEVPMSLTLPGVKTWWDNDRARMSQKFVS